MTKLFVKVYRRRASVSRRKKKFQKSEKRKRLAGSQRDSIRSIGGKGENHHIPHRKGVRRWKRSPANTVNAVSYTHLDVYKRQL